ncbi:hypothetical protein ACWDRR_05275 [Kitasatospora sp. NPDC003701]
MEKRTHRAVVVNTGGARRVPLGSIRGAVLRCLPLTAPGLDTPAAAARSGRSAAGKADPTGLIPRQTTAPAAPGAPRALRRTGGHRHAVKAAGPGSGTIV